MLNFLTSWAGIVVVKELNKASGVWSMQSQISAKTAGTWRQFGYN